MWSRLNGNCHQTRETCGLGGGWQHRGATHSLAQGVAHASFAKSINAFFSSSVPGIKRNYVTYFKDLPGQNLLDNTEYQKRLVLWSGYTTQQNV